MESVKVCSDQRERTAGHLFRLSVRALDAQTQVLVPGQVIGLGALLSAW